MARTLPYRDGDWFGVPLATKAGGYALGIIVQHHARGTVFGYLFAVQFDDLPEPSMIRFDVSHAAFGARFGDLSLLDGRWPVIGRSRWERDAWPPPTFCAGSPRQYFEVSYDIETLRPSSYEPISAERAALLPRAVSNGVKVLERRLTDAVFESRPGGAEPPGG